MYYVWVEVSSYEYHYYVYGKLEEGERRRRKVNINNELTKRDELSFLTVLALPKASKMGLAWRSCASSSPWCPVRPAFMLREVLVERRLRGALPFWCPDPEATTAKYWMTFLVFSVFPAPDSPLEGGMEGERERERERENE